MPANKSVQYRAVHDAIVGGGQFKDAVREHGVSATGYRQFAKAHELPTFAALPTSLKCQAPSSSFKGAEKEIRATRVAAVAKREGLTLNEIYQRKKRAGFEDLIAEIDDAPSTAEICRKHGITVRQLYNWRRATGGVA